MTTAALSDLVALDVAPPSPAERLRFGWADTMSLTRRDLLIWLRNPALLFFVIIQPVMFTLLFRYVFGGAIPVKVPGGYVDYLMPGIIGQSAAFASFGTAIALARLVACIKQAAGFQRAMNAPENSGEFVFWHMQQTGVGPNAIVRIAVVQLVEAHRRNRMIEPL